MKPVITPILMLLRHTAVLPRRRQSHPQSLQSIPWLPLILGAASATILSPSLNPSKLFFTIFALSGLVHTYACLVRIFDSDMDKFRIFADPEDEKTLRYIMNWVVGTFLILALALLLLFVPISSPDIGVILVAGVSKATHWIAAFWLVR